MKDEWWKAPPNHPNLSLSQDVENITSWDAAAFSDSAAPIPHRRPWPPRRQSGSISNECSWRTSLSSAPRPRPGNGDRARLASSSRALPFKSWSLKSGEHMTFNSDMWISLIQNLANNAESDSCLQHLHIRQLSLNRDEWWNYRTSKPSKLVTVKGCRKHMKTEAFSGGLYRQNLITEILRTNICKYEKNISNMWISLMRNLANNGNQPRNPHFHSPSTCSKKSPRSNMNDETPAPPNHPNLSLSKDVRDMTSWHAAAFSDSAEPIPHTRPLCPRHQCRWKSNRCSWRTSLSSAPRPRPGNRDRSRLASSSRALPFKSWSLKSGEHMTFNSDMWISLIQNLANNAESDSCLQHLHIWQLSLRWKMNDETPAPPNHPNLSLSQDAGKVWESDIMTCRSIQRFCGAHPTHQALAPSSPIGFPDKSMSVTDAFVFSASAKAWKQRQIKAGVFIQGSTVQIVITEIRRTHDI